MNKEHKPFKKKLNQKIKKSLKGKTEEGLKKKIKQFSKNEMDRIDDELMSNDEGSVLTFIEFCELKAELKGYQSAKAQTIKEVEKIIDKIKIVKCAGMSKEFIEGSDWCNHIWKRKIMKLEYQIKKLGDKDVIQKRA